MGPGGGVMVCCGGERVWLHAAVLRYPEEARGVCASAAHSATRDAKQRAGLVASSMKPRGDGGMAFKRRVRVWLHARNAHMPEETWGLCTADWPHAPSAGQAPTPAPADV